MVKGRRTRQANVAGQLLAASSSTAGVDDTASPKRKDFKFDNNVCHFANNVVSAKSVETMDTAAPMVLRGGRTKANGIVKYLTSSGKPSTSTASELGAISKINNIIDLTDENTCDSFENIANGSANTGLTESSLASLGFSVIKSNPEIQNKFSPPKCDPMWGSAAASVSIKQEHSEYILDLSKPTQVTQIDSTTFLNQDSNSCDSGDSGVVILPSNALEPMAPASEGRRRKPATPHRILCPSPVKLPIVASPSTALAHLNIRATRKNVKSKRRLNTKESENSTVEQTAAEVPGVNPLPIGPSSVVAVPMKEALVDKKKPVLNDSVNPTAQQNTNNNNQSSKQNEVPLAAPAIVGKPTEAGTNKKLTDFFQVRRSVRKTKKEVQWERDRDIEKAIREERESGLEIVNFEGKGRGIVTSRPFMKGEFVVEYIGDLITVAEAKQREQIYAEDDTTGCYMYYFKYGNIQHCIDATAETGKLGRLVNHSRNGNLMTKTVSLSGKPHLVLIAKEDIAEGVEVTYDYGDRSKEALQHYPWLAY